MSVLAEAMIAAFDSTMRITWTTTDTTMDMSTAIATFTHNDLLVTTTFAKVGAEEWQVGFTVSPEMQPATGVVRSSIRIFSGVFQAVREFLEVRQPLRLVFASKNEALGSLYETYLQRQDTELKHLGYGMAKVSIDPLVEFALEKSTPSAWSN